MSDWLSMMEGNSELGKPEGLKAATSASFGFNQLNDMEDMEELDKGVFLLLGPHNAWHTRTANVQFFIYQNSQEQRYSQFVA